MRKSVHAICKQQKLSRTFESNLVANPEDRISRDVAHMYESCPSKSCTFFITPDCAIGLT